MARTSSTSSSIFFMTGDRIARTTAIGLCVGLFSIGGSGGCSGGDDTPVPAIYVSVTGDDSAPGTTPDAPLASIPLALERALECVPEPCRVHVTGGEFIETVTLVDGVEVRGGYASDFSERDLDTFTTVIVGDQMRAVIADGLTAPVTLDGVHIRGIDASGDNNGRSSIGLWVRNSGEWLRVINGTITGGDAAEGVHGTPGEERSCAIPGGVGGEAFDCGSNAGMVGIADGDPQGGGTGGSGGGSNCPNACPLVGDDGISDGQPGTSGTSGADGQSGLSGVNTTGSIVAGAWVGATSTGGTRGDNGTGGGGGGSGGSKRFRACFGCDTLLGGRGGDGGDGGCGGTGGLPGEPGGSSFGAVIIDSALTLHNVQLVGGRGGRGGRGGDGGPGTPGGSDGAVGQQGRASQQCGLINYHSGAGAMGGAGGDGGHGGGGAGGVGGVAPGLALVGTGAIIVGDEVAIQAGEPGRGGFGGFGGMANGEDGLGGDPSAQLVYP